LILDLGCGKKPYYHKFIKGKLICSDINKSRTANLICDSHNIPFKKEKFDKVLCINAFYYFSNPFVVIEEVYRILKKDGKLILMLPFIYPIHDVPVDKYRFTEYGIRNLLKDKFKIEKIETIGSIFNLPSVILHSLIKGIPLISPKYLKNIIKIITTIISYPFYLFFQLFSLLDFLDFTKRWPTYYFVIASKN
jgi:SAM-dependent methyltransferase